MIAAEDADVDRFLCVELHFLALDPADAAAFAFPFRCFLAAGYRAFPVGRLVVCQEPAADEAGLVLVTDLRDLAAGTRVVNEQGPRIGRCAGVDKKVVGRYAVERVVVRVLYRRVRIGLAMARLGSLGRAFAVPDPDVLAAVLALRRLDDVRAKDQPAPDVVR